MTYRPIAHPIEGEWYKRHRRSDPDFLSLCFERGYGEFSEGYDESFNKHLQKIKINKK